METRASTSQFQRRRVRLTLRHGRIVEGNIHVTEGQSLALFMATRRFFANLTEVAWAAQSERLQHLAVRAEQVYWVASLDAALPVSATLPPTRRERWAELIMDDGTVLHVGLYIADEQRMTDYIDAASGFLPVPAALIVSSEHNLGEVVVNTGAVLAIREIDPPRR